MRDMIMKKVIGIAFTVVLTIGLINTNAQNKDEFHLDEEYTIDAEGTINLQSDDAEVRIIGTNRSDVRVKVDYLLTVKGFTFGSSSKFKMIVEERSGNLEIREKPREFGNRGVIGYQSEEYTILIEVPKGVSLNINGDDETYDISDINGAITLKADDSEARLTNCGGDSFSFTMDDGNIEMDTARGSLRLQMDDGTVDIRNAKFSSIQARGDDTEIHIVTSLDDDGRYRFDGDDSDITLDIVGGGGEFQVDHDDADIDVSSEFEVLSDEDGRARYRLPGGNATVTVQSDDGNITFRVF